MNFSHRQNIWVGFAASVFLAGLVTALLLMPVSGGTPWPVPHIDKAIHAGLFFAVALPAMLVTVPRLHWALWALVVGYSGVTEIIQPWFGRGADPMDLAANAAGAALALGVARWRFRSKAAKVEQNQRTESEH